MTAGDTALVVGVGPGLGSALARRFARAGMNVAVAARNGEKLGALCEELQALGVQARTYACDATDEQAVLRLFGGVRIDLGPPRLVTFNAGAFMRAGVLDTSVTDFERCWRVGCLGGFIVGREAARALLQEGGGTIIFTGATASLRGGAMFQNLAVGKFGLRALAQSMAREFQPRGIHVAHMIIDGQIKSNRPGYRAEERGTDALLEPDAIAETYYQIHAQPRSAWTLEVDLRPWVEKF